MVGGQENLFSGQSKLACHSLQGIYGRTVNTGLTGLPKPPIADSHAEAFQQAFQRSGPAI
jgi:hypothetical protein